MSSDAVVKSVGKKLRYYFEVKRLEDGFDLSGVNRPILDHPRLKPRRTLQCSLLKDVPLKHHFRSPSIRVRLTQFPGVNAPGSPREKQVKRALESYITRSDFVHPYLSSYSYIHTSKGRKLRPESSSALHTGTRSSKKRSIKGGCPVIRSAPPHYVTKKQADRLVTVASKILVANETIDLKDHKPRPPNGPKIQSAPAPFETNKPLPTIETETRPKTSRGFHRKNRNTDEGRDSAYTTDRTSPGSDEYLGKDGHGSAESGSTKSSDSDTERSPRPPAGGRPATRRSRPVSARTLHQNQIMDIAHPLSGEVGIELGVQTRGTVAIQTDSRGDMTEKDLDEGDHIVRAGPPAQYHIYVRTGKRIGASTKAHVKITLYGEHGRSQEFLLAESQRHKIKFQKGHEDLFTVYTPHVGRLKCVKIGHDRPELMYAWFLEGVTVEDTVDKRVYECPCERWLSGQDGDKKTYRVLPVDRDRALIKDSDDDSGSDVSYIKKYGEDTESERDDSPRRSPDSVKARRSAGSSKSSSSDSETDSDTETDTSSSESTQREIIIPVKPPSTDVKVTQTTQSKPTRGEHHYEESKILVSPGRKMKDDFFDQRPAGPVYTFRTGTSVDSREDANTEKPELSITETDSETSKTTTSDYSETNKAAVIMPISRFPVIAEEDPKQRATPDTSEERNVSPGMAAAPQRVVPRIAVDRVEEPIIEQTGGFSGARVLKEESGTESGTARTTSDSVTSEKKGAVDERLNQPLTVKKSTSSEATEGTTTETGSNTDRTAHSGSATDRTTQSGSATDRTTQSGSGIERSSTTSGSSTDRTATEVEQSTNTKKVDESSGKTWPVQAVNGYGAPSASATSNTEKPEQAADSGTEDSDSDSSSSNGSESESDSDSESDGETPRPEQVQPKKEDDKIGYSQKESMPSPQVSQTVTTVSGETLHEAAKAGKLTIVTEIIQSHPDKINELNEVGWTALHVAASEGQLEVAQWLGQNGAELNKETPTGYSAIHLAALHGHATTLKLLASLGGTVNCLTTDQQTPLHLAALSGHVEIAKWLITNGVDIGARDESDRTALDLAVRNEQDEVTEYLRSFAGKDASDSGKPVEFSVENGTHNNSVTDHVEKFSAQTSQPSSPHTQEEDLKEKRHLYEEQKSKMDESGLSFLDSIRQELEQD
ncbi:uncharacterized protein LOC135473625 isoform X2 [Liolophura sinensis]|uniref:uncharacterized protein LOC135473625 isoform X2 n=1 Tax=Liolophura sinensis TaxID=3198878 RepID=UPI003158B98D